MNIGIILYRKGLKSRNVIKNAKIREY